MQLRNLLCIAALLAGCTTESDPAVAPDAGDESSVDAGREAAPDAAPTGEPDAALGVDHPEPLCDDSRTHLRGILEGVDVLAHLCDFKYALIAFDPWANWTRFEDGMLVMSGDGSIFDATDPTVPVRSGLLRMPGVTASGGRVYCGFDNGSYYEARDESAPDAEFVLELSGYAGTCGGTGTGTVDLRLSYTEDSTAQISIGNERAQRTVSGAYGIGTEYSFTFDGGIIDLELEQSLPDEGAGRVGVVSATIAMRDGSRRLLLACGEIQGTLDRTASRFGNEYALRLSGIPPWLDCADTTPAHGAFTLTHDPRP